LVARASGVEDGVMTAQREVAEQIRALEDKRYEAMTAGDVATLDELFAADVVYTHSDASSDSKQGYLDRLASGYFKYGPISHPETSIVVRGDCVLVFGDMRGEVHIGGQLRVLNSASLTVWVRENERWALLAYQPTKRPS
jgi:ketosteroid isomerase-like protein